MILQDKFDLITNLIKIISPPFTDISHGVGDLKKHHLHGSDSYVPANENFDFENMKMLLNCFACYEQSDWPKNIFIISLITHDIRSLIYDL